MTTAKIRTRSETLLAEGKLQEAGNIVSEALALQPHDGQLIIAKAGVMVAGKQFRQAVDTLRPLLKRKPDLTDAWFLLGNAYRALTQFHDAKEAYREVLKRDEAFPGVYHYIGFCCQQLGDLNGAESGYRKALEQFDDPLLHYRLGNLLHRAGRTGEGIACYREVLKRQPRHQQALSALTIALLDEKRDAEALGAAAEHVSQHPSNSMALVNLTYAAHLGGDKATVDALLDYDNLVRTSSVGTAPETREKIAAATQDPQLPPEAQELVTQLDRLVREYLEDLSTQPLRYWAKALPDQWQTRYTFLPIDPSVRDFPHCHPQAIAAGTYVLNGSSLAIEFGRGDEVYRHVEPPRLHIAELEADHFVLHPGYLMYQVLDASAPCIAVRCEVIAKPAAAGPDRRG